jgi:hypothetical protein
MMMRLLLICGMALVLAPIAFAGGTTPALSTSCNPCANDGSYVTVTASGLKSGTSYFADVIGQGSDGVDFFWQRTGYLAVQNGVATFLVGPVSVPVAVAPATYTVSLYTNQGRGTIKLVAQTVFTVL